MASESIIEENGDRLFIDRMVAEAPRLVNALCKEHYPLGNYLAFSANWPYPTATIMMLHQSLDSEGWTLESSKVSVEEKKPMEAQRRIRVKRGAEAKIVIEDPIKVTDIVLLPMAGSVLSRSFYVIRVDEDKQLTLKSLIGDNVLQFHMDSVEKASEAWLRLMRNALMDALLKVVDSIDISMMYGTAGDLTNRLMSAAEEDDFDGMAEAITDDEEDPMPVANHHRNTRWG